MRGTILGYDPVEEKGVITTANGERINFERSEWKSPGEPVAGRHVDFAEQNGVATGIFTLPGSNPLSMEGKDPNTQALTYGGFALGSAIVSYLLGPIGILTLVLAVVLGIKGKNIGADLPDRTGYYMSIAALVLAGIGLLFLLFALTACAGLIGLLGMARY